MGTRLIVYIYITGALYLKGVLPWGNLYAMAVCYILCSHHVMECMGTLYSMCIRTSPLMLGPGGNYYALPGP